MMIIPRKQFFNSSSGLPLSTSFFATPLSYNTVEEKCPHITSNARKKWEGEGLGTEVEAYGSTILFNAQ